MTNSYKKEYPLAGFPGFGGGAGALYYKSAATKIYVDEVFSTQTYIGNDSNRSFVNGLDLSTEGGLVWTKSRTGSSAMLHLLFDTERGVTKDVTSQSSGAEGTSSTMFTAFNTDGYSVGTSAYTNENNSKFASWSFRKSEGFFDVIKYTGTGSTQNISHSLGSAPGFILVKNLSSSIDWAVWHRASAEEDATNTLILNSSGAEATNNTYFDDGSTPPTATQFTVHTSNRVNASGSEYVAYVFAGGASTAATARSIEHNGSSYFQTSASTDFEFTGDFTFECWFNPDSVSGKKGIFNLGVSSQQGGFEVYTNGTDIGVDNVDGQKFRTNVNLTRDQWYHIAFVRSGSAIKLYLNGTYINGYTDSSDYGVNSGGNRSYFMMGTGYNGSVEHYFDGHISNVRVLNGTALYTSSFKPPTEPLTNITNTKLLCCNNASVTGSTVAPTALTNSGATASTYNPFDDSEGFKFGDDGEGIIKCGSYKGNGSSTGPEINLGFEPQWVMVKNSGSTGNWFMFDSMRGIIADGYDAKFAANESNLEENDTNWLDLTPTGFQLKSTNSNVNADHTRYIYMAIRRPDGYVGKPAEAGTDVFVMAGGNSTAPTWISGFPVGFAMYKRYAYVDDWIASARQIQGKYLAPSNATAENSHTSFTFDKNNGWGDLSLNSTWLSYMWKRHAGFTICTYEGNGVSGRDISHDLGPNNVPEMIWIKCRSITKDWPVYHKGLNGGSSPEDYVLLLNEDGAESDDANVWNDTSPTTTNFTIGSSSKTNSSSENYMAMLFSSVTGISKVGSYSGANSNQTITLGFQPKFIIIKSTSGSRNWVVLDTVRGWSSGSNDSELNLNKSDAAGSSYDFGGPTATGFTINYIGNDDTNASGHTYIYYAHV
tara:strand:+ start:234 stop:2873 length:2640 start_codon:yes stop_codon:yes gene_type:complete